MKVLVTGADGFVGTHLVRALRARGDVVEACGGPGGQGGAGDHRCAGRGPAGRRGSARRESSTSRGSARSARSHAAPGGRRIAVNVVGAANVLEAVREHAPRARVLLSGRARCTEQSRARIARSRDGLRCAR